jgi:uncharacterized protein YggE
MEVFVTDSLGPVLSVRGHARQSVPPDSASIFGSLEVVDESKVAVLDEASRLVGQITIALEALGAVAQEAGTERRPLTWSTRTVGTRKELIHNYQTQQAEETGRIFAHVAMQFEIRDFELLDPLADALAKHEMFNIHGVNWHVDDDNPGWRLVRAEAIHAAIRQGRDYASALGCSLIRVEHVADAGLLGSGAPEAARGVSALQSASRMSGDPGGGPSLDPIPQELTATIEARFTTTPVTLPEPR